MSGRHPVLVYHICGRRRRSCGLLAGLAALLLVLGLPARASAHGAVDPEASVDLAHVTHVPAGLRVRMVDGDLRLWMAVPARMRVTVADYQGAAYLRFTPRGVWANESSPMFYLDLEPPITPSLSLTRHTPPSWHLVSRGHSYEWHDGRIAALSESLAAPDAHLLGRWMIPLRVDGRAATIGGVLDHRPRPSLAWLWPAAVVILTLPALLRLHDGALERRLARGAAAITLLAVLVAALGAGLHRRPGLSGTLLAVMAVELALGGWAAWRLARGRSDPLTLAVVATLAFYRAIPGVAVLWRGYVLLAVPATVGRIAIAICIAGGIGLGVGVVVALDRMRPSATRRFAR